MKRERWYLSSQAAGGYQWNSARGGGGGVGSYELGVGCFGGVIGDVVDSLTGGRNCPDCLDEKAVG